MVEKLINFHVYAHPFGSQLDVTWEFPESLPENYEVYVFKRSESDVTDNDINGYFNHVNAGNDPKTYVVKGLFVFDKDFQLKNSNGVYDYFVRNGIAHYYKAVIRDEESLEISEIVSSNNTPDILVEAYVEDGKDMVIKSITKMYDTLKDKNGNKLKYGKDIKVVRQFPITKIEEDQVCIERINGNTQYSYWGNLLASYQNQLIIGELDIDVIRATFFTIGGPERRDATTNVLRARKLWLHYMLKNLGAKHVSISLEGDYRNAMIHGDNALGVTMVFSLLMENRLKIDYNEINQHIAELRITT